MASKLAKLALQRLAAEVAAYVFRPDAVGRRTVIEEETITKEEDGVRTTQTVHKHTSELYAERRRGGFF